MPDFSNSQNLGLGQQLRQRQEQVLSHEQRLGLEILQKDMAELQTEINRQLQMNPALLELQAPCLVFENQLPEMGPRDGTPTQEERELDENALEYRERLLSQAVERLPEGGDASGNGEAPSANIDDFWTDGQRSSWGVDDEERRQHFFDSISREPGFLELLLKECDSSIDGTPEFIELCRKLCCAVNGAGYLEGTDEELCQITGASLEDVHRGIEAIQTLEPPGIGARNLQECLLLQLKRMRLVGSIEWDIISEHLDDLEHNRLPKIAKEMEFELDEIQDAVARIRKLSAKPGEELYSEALPTVMPDVFVEKNEDGQWNVRNNHEAISQLTLDADYVRMMSDDRTDAETKKYLREKINSASMLIHAIDQRETTVLRIAVVLIALQPKFFETGRVEELLPLNLERVADRLELAGSTISRAIAGKYMETPWGTFSFKSFFASGYRSENGEQVSSMKVRQRIKEIIAGEDPRHPISDQDISDKLLHEGFTVKRRTVAKYRELDGIPTTSQRRVHS